MRAETIRLNDTFAHDFVQLTFWDNLNWMDSDKAGCVVSGMSLCLKRVF